MLESGFSRLPFYGHIKIELNSFLMPSNLYIQPSYQAETQEVMDSGGSAPAEQGVMASLLGAICTQAELRL